MIREHETFQESSAVVILSDRLEWQSKLGIKQTIVLVLHLMYPLLRPRVL